MISVLGAIAQAITGRTELPKHACLFYRKDGYSVGAVGIDLILDEHHSKDAEVTENPLQDGRSVSDGIYLKLREGSLNGLVSNHSLKHATPPDIQSSEALMEQAENDTLDNRARKAWEDLKGIMDRKELVTIVTALEVYENVAITHIETDRDGESGDALEIQISFRQVQTVRLRGTRVSLAVQPKDMESEINRTSSVNVDSGQTVGVDIPDEERNQLFLGVQ